MDKGNKKHGESMTETYQREAQSMILVSPVIHTSCNDRLQLSLAHQDLIGYDQHEPEISVANGLEKVIRRPAWDHIC